MLGLILAFSRNEGVHEARSGAEMERLDGVPSRSSRSRSGRVTLIRNEFPWIPSFIGSIGGIAVNALADC